jgi:hypothetical protein
VTDHVGGNDPAGPNVGDWLDAPGPSQEIDMGALMVTLHQAAVALRTAMHEAQQVARDVQVQAMRNEATDIRNSAGFSFAAAVVAGSLQIAGGALDVGGSFHAYKTAFPGEEIQTESKAPGQPGTGSRDVFEPPGSEPDGVEEAPPAEKSDPVEENLDKTLDKIKDEAKKQQEDLDFRKRSQHADILLKRYSGLSQAVQGMGQIISGGLEFGSHQKDADEKEHEADATKAASQVEDADNLLKNIDDLISGVRQSFSQMIEAKNQAMNKINQA